MNTSKMLEEAQKAGKVQAIAVIYAGHLSTNRDHTDYVDHKQCFDNAIQDYEYIVNYVNKKK